MARLWIQKAIKKPGALREELEEEGYIKEGEKISPTLINELISRLQKKREREGKLSPADRKLLRRLILARTLRGLGK
jgi:hypothetical protein